MDVTAVRGSQLTYCVEVAAELLADVEEQTVRPVHQAQRPGRESPEGRVLVVNHRLINQEVNSGRSMCNEVRRVLKNVVAISVPFWYSPLYRKAS